MKLIEEIKSNIKLGIEEERERMNEKYNEDIKNVDELNDVPTLMKQLVNIYGNTMEQKEKMIGILNSYLKANFFKFATNGRMNRDIIKGANSAYYNNRDYYVGFSTSRVYTVEVGRNEHLRKPNETFGTNRPDIVEFVELWEEYESTGERYDEVIDLYSIMKRAKPATILYKMRPSLRSDIKDFAEDQKKVIAKHDKLKKMWECKIEEFEKEKAVFQDILKDLEDDLNSFKEAGWSIIYENLDSLM